METIKMTIEETRTITFKDGLSVNESVMVIWTTMTTEDGNSRRMLDGDIMPFQFIWNDVLGMETDDPEDPESRIRAVMMCRLDELKLKYPEKTSTQVLSHFRQSCEELYHVFRKGIMERRKIDC
jgi:hypothetical protein